MKISPWLAALMFSLGAAPGFAAPSDADAHVKLTDGVRATSDPEHSAWLTLFADRTELPRTSYSLGDFCFWGNNAPFTNTPTGNPAIYQMIKDANIRGVRYDVPWYGVAQYKTPQFDWYGMESNVNRYVEDGFSVLMVLSYTPHWANGMKDRQFPPKQSVEGELLDLTSGSATLQHSPVIMSQQDHFPFVVVPENVPVVRVNEEVITTNFKEGDQPRVSQHPIKVGTEQVWVDEGSGYELWTRVDNLIDSPDGAKHYEIDRAGRVKFRSNKMFWYRGKTPVTGAKVKVSYDALQDVYLNNVDFIFNHMTGQVTRRMATISGGIPLEEFSNSTLDPKWQWMNPPASWDVNTSVAGNLSYTINHTPANTIGHYLYQTLTGSGDFKASMKVSAARSQAGAEAQTGILVYQDANNWFRFSLSNNAGRPLLTRCINGTVSVYGGGGELGFLVTAPRRLTVQKDGNNWKIFPSVNSLEGPDGGYQSLFTFTQELNYPLRVGISSVGTDATGSQIDDFRLSLPTMGTSPRVRVFYDYLDTDTWTDFVTSMVNHFKDRVKYWELWNEPDQWWCWNGGQDLIAIMMREGAKAVKTADPTAVVVSGGYANGAAGNLATIYNTIGNSWFDVIAWHPYLFDNRPPDTINWGPGRTNGEGRGLMVQHGDESKGVFFGELASASGVLGAGGGMNDRKQLEYGGRMLLWSRKLGWVNGIQWWPGVDMAAVGDQEDHIFGAHEGLFYSTGQPKPIYWLFKAMASNRGVLLDLVNYDGSGNPVPAKGRHTLSKIRVGAQDRSRIANIKVYTSLTGTDASCKPALVAARHIGGAGTAPLKVTVNSNSASLKTEKWTVTALNATTFEVRGDQSGLQGNATVGLAFTSTNGVVQFTIPAGQNPYVAGDRFEFETFKGDGWVLSGEWTNNGSITGHGDIEFNLTGSPEARYVSVEFERASGASNIRIDELQVLNLANQNVAASQLYVVDGYQDYWENQKSGEIPGISLTLSGLPANPKPGDRVDLTVSYQNTGFGNAANVVIQHSLPANTDYIAASASHGGVFDAQANKVRWILPTLASGATGQLTFAVRVK